MKLKTTTHGSKGQKIVKDGKHWKVNMRRQQHATGDSATHREKPPQDPIRPARYLNGVKVDERELASYVIFSTGNLVTVKKMQFVDLTSEGLMRSNQ